MRKLFTLICFFISINSNGQFLKEVYNDFLKYGTFYVAGDVSNSYQTQRPNYFIRTDPDNLYAIPDVIDNTIYHPYDYRIGIGFRKLARFDYEIKAKPYYDGTENNKALSSPTAAVKGLEYLIHYERERERSEEFSNLRYFLRHTGKHHIVKIEQRKEGNVGFHYASAEARARLPIGKKFSISAGAMLRFHEKAYGYNPVEIWLNEMNDYGNAANTWYTLGHQYGYSDHYTSYSMDGLPTVYDWIWMDEDNNVVAYGDKDFRDRVMPDLMNRYNNEQWDLLSPFMEVAPVVGFDFYHYRKNFWVHSYGSYLLPYHKYVKGEEQFSYLHRNGWGKEGHNMDHAVTDGEQWSDYQAGIIFGWKISKSIGIFAEGEYTKFWDSEIFNSSVGINFTFR